MFAMRKIDSAETRKGNSRVRVKIPKKTGKDTSTANPKAPPCEVPGRDGQNDAVAFSLIFSQENKNDNTTTKSLILAQDER